MVPSVLIFTPSLTPRAEYAIRHLLGGILRLGVEFTDRPERVGRFAGPSIAYAQDPVGRALHIVPHSLLAEVGVRDQRVGMGQWEGLRTLFPTQGGAIPFDPFAAAFYLIARYEEYLPFPPDPHGRYPASLGIAHREGFLEIPLVDQWAQGLGQALRARFPRLALPRGRFRFIPTIDIDNAYAYRHKGVVRTLGALARSLIRFNFSEISQRLAVLRGISPDPYDTYSRLFGVLAQHPEAIWFFLGGRRGPLDRHIPLTSPAMRQLIGAVAQRFAVGAHPSYGSWGDPRRVEEEVHQLAGILGAPVAHSRQHFLRLSLSKTYTILAQLGIANDYTMGYPDRLGFRASTCTPFPFYCLAQERELPIRVHPFQMMDVTLRHSLGLSPREAVGRALQLAGTIRRVRGTMMCIWHNESISGVGAWRGWDDVLPKIIEGVALGEGEAEG